MPRVSKLPHKIKLESPWQHNGGEGDSAEHDELLNKPLGLVSHLEDGDNSDEYIDTSLGRSGAGDMNDDESYIKASHDLLEKCSEHIIPKSSKKLRFSLTDDDLPSGNSSAEEKAHCSPWVEVKTESRRRRKSPVVKRYHSGHDSDSDDGSHKNGDLTLLPVKLEQGQSLSMTCVNIRHSLSTNQVDDSTVEIHRPAQENVPHLQTVTKAKEPKESVAACSSAADDNSAATPGVSKQTIMVPLSLIQGKANCAVHDQLNYINVLSEQNGYICHICQYSGKLPYLLENHMKATHLPHQPYTCMECRKGFYLRGTAMCHIRIKHPNGSQMIIDQEVETRQSQDCSKLMQLIARCHVCDSLCKTSSNPSATRGNDGKLYVCQQHAENYSIGVNITDLYKS